MQRAWLRKGDTSSVGGVVLDGIENVTHHGVPCTFIGARVECPACQSIGHIEAAGHRCSVKISGKEQALEGDVCQCKCDPPPTMIASQHSGVQSFNPAAPFTGNLDRGAPYVMAGGGAVTAMARAYFSSALPSATIADGSAAASTPLGNAMPFIGGGNAPSDTQQDLAARGVGEEDEAECYAQYQRDMDLCRAIAAAMGGVRGQALCEQRAFDNYQRCRGY